MDIYGQLIKKKTKKLLKNKKYRIRIFIILACAVLLIFRSCINELKTKAFFNRHPDNMMIWKLPAEDMITALADRFLGKDVEVQVYDIKPWDNYWLIARTNQIDFDTIIGCNPYITSLYAAVGEKIIAVNKKGVLHYIQENEDLDILSELYKVKKSMIKKNNKIGLFSGLKKGYILFIPGVKPKVYSEKMSMMMKRRQMFCVPTNGWVAGRGFGYNRIKRNIKKYKLHPILKVMRIHKGIDMKASKGTPVFAAADGVIKLTGSGGTYGKVIYIDHANGFQTRYAHLSKIYIKTGQIVKKRKCIGRVGNTGLSTHSHLHFEIRTNDKPINPMKFLW